MHVAAPSRLRRNLAPHDGILVYIPAAASPLKDASPRAADQDRLDMLKAALRRDARRVIWTDELDRAAWHRARGETPPPSYTIDTVRRLRRALGAQGRTDVALRLLIGADQATQFHRWKDARRLLRLCPPIVMLRAPCETREALLEALRAAGWTRAELERWSEAVAPIPARLATSTDVRAALHGAPPDTRRWKSLAQRRPERRPLLDIPAASARIITRRKLYGTA
jgi:nicotinic acid mononucleotide adenylyltransferase